MTTRDSLHQLLDHLSDSEIEALARMAREHEFESSQGSAVPAERGGAIEARQYPVLAAIWDNDDDTVFDDL
ncbi:MAG: hypothetical protein IT301_13770 [Dehalococcoidia bacterium]|nr:hypothetical protein [Dehalococcoidia bacterium]